MTRTLQVIGMIAATVGMMIAAEMLYLGLYNLLR